MLRFFWTLVATLVGICVVYAYNPTDEGSTIYGQIIENGLNEGVPYADVLIVETGQSTMADDQGKFKFINTPEGNYRIRVSMMGYRTQEQLVAVKKDSTTNVQILMDVDELLLDEVVVSASRNEVSRREAPIVVSVLGPKVFQAVGATDLAKTLSFQSGLRVENNCQNCGFPQVRINGLDGTYSQILINSRPVISSLAGVYGLEQIPVNMIDRVEVVRGGGSALFGANAIGGVINIITKDPVNNSFQASTTVSNMNGKGWEEHVGANVSLVSEDNTYGIALYESYRNRSPYDHDGDGFSELGKLTMNTFGLRAYYRPVASGRLSLEYHTTNEFRRGGNDFDLQPHESDITEQTRHIINSGGLNYDHFWNNYKHKLTVYGSAQHIDRESYYGAQEDPNAYGKTNDLTWVAGAMYVGNMDRFLFAPATFTGGMEYQNNSLHDVMTGYHRDMRQDVHIAGAFVQNEWKMNRLSLLVGARLDKHNLIDHLIFVPRVNLLYKPLESLQARLTYSTGFRAPQAYDEDLHVTAVGGEGVQIRLADGLREERSSSYSGSVDWTANLGHWQMNVLLEGFYTDLKDVFVLEDIGLNEHGDMVKERRNGSGAYVYGLNLDARIAHGKEAQLQLGFTAQRSRYRQPEVWTTVNGVNLTTIKMPRTPDYYGYFTFISEPFRNFDFSISGIYTGRMIVPHYAGYIAEDRMETTPDFFELNVKVNYTFDLRGGMRLQLNTGVQNVLNSFQKDLDCGVFRDSGYFYGPTQPRTYFVGLKLMI